MGYSSWNRSVIRIHPVSLAKAKMSYAHNIQEVPRDASMHIDQSDTTLRLTKSKIPLLF